ncbi:MAG: ATP-binding protein [bacterium]
MLNKLFSFTFGVKTKYVLIMSAIVLILGVALTKNVLVDFQREVLEENTVFKLQELISTAKKISVRYKSDKKYLKKEFHADLVSLCEKGNVMYLTVEIFKKQSFKDIDTIFSYGKAIEDRTIIARSLAEDDLAVRKINKPPLFELAVPFYTQKRKSKKPTGIVRLGYDYSFINKKLTGTIWKGISFTLILLVISVLFLVFAIDRDLLLPLRKLTLATVAASHGDLRQEVDIDTGDELGILARSFNLMIHDLREWRTKLEQANFMLEEKVKERVQDLNKLNEELTNTNTQLNELNKVKTNFISMVSHELRTPLTAIKGFVSTLLREDIQIDKQTRDKYLRICDKESDRLGRLIDDLLNITSVESGKMELFYDKLDIEKLVHECVEHFAPKLNNKKIALDFEESFPKVDADKDKIKRVVCNLLDNAIKYSPADGEITIAGRILEDEIEVSVEDRGMGISDAQLEKVFEKFYRIDDEINRKNPGTGLGLSISRAIIELHNGIIWSESEQNKGSRFVFTLPIKKPDAADQA